GPRLDLEEAVHLQTGATAGLYGLDDRGTVAAGKRADLNLIDFDGLHLHAPEMVFDLPAGGRRLVPRVDGCVATLVAAHATGDMCCLREVLETQPRSTRGLPGPPAPALDPLLVDWRAPAAAACSRATARQPAGVILRRHLLCEGRRLLAIDDEVFDPDAIAED